MSQAYLENLFFGKDSETEDSEEKSPTDYPDTPLSSKEDEKSEGTELSEESENNKDRPLMITPPHLRFAVPFFSSERSSISNNELYGLPPPSPAFKKEMRALGLPIVEKEEDDTLNEIRTTLGKKGKKSKESSLVPLARSQKQSTSISVVEKKMTITIRELTHTSLSLLDSFRSSSPLTTTRITYSTPLSQGYVRHSEISVKKGKKQAKLLHRSFLSSQSSLSTNRSSLYTPATSYLFPPLTGPKSLSRTSKLTSQRSLLSLPPPPPSPTPLPLPPPPSSTSLLWHDAFKDEEDEMMNPEDMYSDFEKEEGKEDEEKESETEVVKRDPRDDEDFLTFPSERRRQETTRQDINIK